MKHSSHGSSPKASLGSVDDPMDILHQLIGVHPDHTINSFSMETTQFGTTATVEILLSPESLAKMYEALGQKNKAVAEKAAKEAESFTSYLASKLISSYRPPLKVA